MPNPLLLLDLSYYSGFSRTVVLCVTVLFCANFSFVRAQTDATPTPTPDEKIAVPTPTVEPAPTVSPEPSESPLPVTQITQTAPIDNAVLLNRVGITTANPIPLTLNETIRRALANNNELEVLREDVRISETRLRSLEGVFDPIFAVTPSYNRNTGSRTGVGSNSFGINLNSSQFLNFGGAQLQPFFNNASSGSSFINSNGITTANTAANGSTTTTFFTSQLGVAYIQPLFRNRSIDNNRRNIRIQRKVLEQSDADFRRRTIEIISQVQNGYWNLVFALRDQQNRQDNLNLTRENLRRVEAQIAAGSVAPLSRAEVSTELATRESDLLIATQQVSISENLLKQLIIREAMSPDWFAQLMPTDAPTFDPAPFNLEEAVTEAVANRFELRRLRLQSEINQVDVEFFRNQAKPQVDLNTNFAFNGYAQTSGATGVTTFTAPLISNDPAAAAINAQAFLLQQINAIRNDSRLNLGNVQNIPTATITANGATPFDGNFRTALGNLFDSNSPSFSVGVTIGIPFRNKTAKANLAGAEIQKTQIEAQTRQQEQAVIVEVRNAVQSVETARLRVLAARTARENAEIQLRGEQKLFDFGRSTTFLLFQRQNTLTNARNSEIRAETDYSKALADLQRATSTTLRNNNIVIEPLAR
ncbi:MAG: TolC family protein [Pyrinomonadaceae bacterium]|nr:TolC family protein [Pyrinomonadaceae bacterium]